LKNKEDGVLDKNKTMDNVQKHKILTDYGFDSRQWQDFFSSAHGSDRLLGPT
jgi:hypothetical protein